MSATETMDPNVQNNGKDGNPPGSADGSTQGGTGDADLQQSSSDASSDGAGGGGEDLSATVRELREEKRRLEEAYNQQAAIVGFVDSHPDIVEELRKRASGQSGGADGVDPSLKKVFDKIDGHYAEADAAFLKDLFMEYGKALEQRAEATVRPFVGEVRRNVAEVEFVRSLRKNGLDAEVVEDPDFQAHLSDLRKTHRSFKATEKNDPSFAAEHAATTWKAKKGVSRDFADQRRRVQDARDSSLNSKGSRASGAAAADATEVPRSMRAILDAIKRGVRPENMKIKR